MLRSPKPAIDRRGVVQLVVGVLLLGAIVLPLHLAARFGQRTLLPRCAPAEAILVRTVASLALLEAVAQAAGVAGLFAAIPLVVLAWVAAALAWAVVMRLRRRTGSCDGTPANSAPQAAPRAPRLLLPMALVVSGAVIAQWALMSLVVARNGIVDYDSLQYHLTHAGTMVQTGRLFDLEHVSVDPTHAFHPLNSEVLHAIGMVAFDGRAWLTPFLNLGWLLFALLVGWCAGTAYGLRPLSLLVMAALLSTPVVVLTQPGSAASDIAAVSLFCSGLVLAFGGKDDSFTLVPAAAALGLAVGTKLSVLAPALLLCAAVIYARRGRLRTLIGPAAVLATTGSVWFVRNAWRTGSPLPTLRIGIGPISLPHPELPVVEATGFTVAHYLGDWTVVREVFIRGVDIAFGRATWALLALAAALLVAAVRTRGYARLLAVIAVGAALSYSITPLTASGFEGEPARFLFVLNLRYLLPCLVVLVPVSALVLRHARPRTVGFVGIVLAVIVFGSQTTRTEPPVWPRSGGRPLSTINRGADVAARWVGDIRNARIGVVGVDYMFVLQGDDLTNEVEFLQRPAPNGGVEPYENCADFLSAVARGGYDYLVFDRAFQSVTGPSPVSVWVEGVPGITSVLEAGSTRVYQVDGEVEPNRCPD